MEDRTLEFFDQWEKVSSEEHDGVYMMPICRCGKVYGIEVRFSSTKYNCGVNNFKELKNFFERRTGGTIRVCSNWPDFRAGVLSLNVGFCNHGYSPMKNTAVLQMFVDEVLPSFRKCT